MGARDEPFDVVPLNRELLRLGRSARRLREFLRIVTPAPTTSLSTTSDDARARPTPRSRLLYRWRAADRQAGATDAHLAIKRRCGPLHYPRSRPPAAGGARRYSGYTLNGPTPFGCGVTFICPEPSTPMIIMLKSPPSEPPLFS